LIANALLLKGYSTQAIQVAQERAWYVEYFTNYAASNMTELIQGVCVCALLMLDAFLTAHSAKRSDLWRGGCCATLCATELHLIGLSDGATVDAVFFALANATRDILDQIVRTNGTAEYFALLGLTLHSIQNFYAHRCTIGERFCVAC
jgi:hypothetical protein